MEALRVAEGCSGPHIFDDVATPNVCLSRNLADCLDADIIVFPCGQDRRFERLARIAIPEPLLRRIAAGQTRLVFDASSEGTPLKQDVTAALHGWLQRFQADPGLCAYLTQERNYETDYRAHCAAIGAQPVQVHVHDYWIWKAVSEYRTSGAEANAQRIRQLGFRPGLRRRRFISLNRTSRPCKLVVLLQLLRDGLFEHGYVSFGGFGLKGDHAQMSAADLASQLPGFEDLIHGLMPQMDRLAAYGTVLFDGGEHQQKAIRAAEMSMYHDSWLSLVTETEMRGRVSRITEKSLKPLLNGHPFIVFGNPGSLRLLREYRFQTFAPWVDESYDEELDPRRRFDLAYKEAARIIRLGGRELARMERGLRDALAFNLRHGLVTLPALGADVRAALIEDLAGRSRAADRGRDAMAAG